MEEKESIDFLFEMIKQIKCFYETPVVYVTYKDYSEVIFKYFCAFRETIPQGDKRSMTDLILEFHLDWLNMVRDLEDFKKALEVTFPRENMERLINYTIETLNNRLKTYRKYIDANRNVLNAENQAHLQFEIELIEEMHKEVITSLEDRKVIIKDCVTELEYKVKVNAAVEEQLLWVDKVTDAFAMKLSKYIPSNISHITTELTKVLQTIVLDLKTAQSVSALQMLEGLKTKGSDIATMIRSTTGHALESSKILNKIVILEDRIKRLEQSDKDKPSAALLGLKNKRGYLLKRINSIDNLKTTLKSLQKITSIVVDDTTEEELCVCEDFFHLKIFNHFLPAESRELLVTELCSVWDRAIFGERSAKSIISILSADETKDVFVDELGTFYIDEYSRRIYKIPDDEDEDARYQPNEHNELVRVSDDSDHIYFYDECGRYYVDGKTKQRVYKAHSKASEYMMDSSGVLLKVKEIRDGVTYYYDNYGRYYIESDGKHIYQDADSISKYENDGLGNLVRIRSHLDMFDPCPGDANVTEDFKYLKENVGKALRHCIGEVLLHQPSDPIKHLSASLIKYRENLELKERRLRENEELNVEREIAIAEELAAAERAAMEAALLTQGASEASYDSNLAKYTPFNHDDESVEPTSNK